MAELMTRVARDVLATLGGVWPFLLLSILAAAAIPVYIGTDRIAALLNRKVWAATAGAVLLATLTPFCSCGTTAVLLGMLATAVPWAPLVAFMVASPLTSPAELVLSAGLFGWPFALVFFLGTIAIGLAAGSVGGVLDRLGWLAGQARVQPEDQGCSTGTCAVPATAGLGPGAASVTEFEPLTRRLKLDRFGRELWATGRTLAVFFLAFTTVGYLAIEAIPTEWLTRYLGGDSLLGVPLAALLGVPAYVNTEASLPLVAALMDGGMGPGPAMAFLVTGAGTSIGAVSGLFVIARTRVVALVVGLLFGGALVLGWLASAIL
jgi:uncharacterized membrane protein YraQ (UPF0718 family)